MRFLFGAVALTLVVAAALRAPTADRFAERRLEAAAVVRRNARHLSDVCMRDVLAATPDGTPIAATLELRIAPSGQVIEASTNASGNFSACLADQARSWVFAPGYAEFELRAPLAFVRGSGGFP